MGFVPQKTVKRGSRSDYVASIVQQLRKEEGEILLWQQELCHEAEIPVAGVYAPVMVALEYLGLVERYLGDAEEDLGKANTGYAWVSDKIKIRGISDKQERKPGQTKAEFNGDDEDAPKSKRQATDGKSTGRKAKQEEPEEEDDEEDGGEEIDLDSMSRGDLKSLIKDNGLDVKVYKSDSEDDLREKVAGALDVGVNDADDEEEEPEEKEAPPKSSRRATSSSSKSGTGSRRRSAPAKDDSEDEAEETPTPRAGRRPRRSASSKAAADDSSSESEASEDEDEAPAEDSPRRRRRRRAA